MSIRWAALGVVKVDVGLAALSFWFDFDNNQQVKTQFFDQFRSRFDRDVFGGRHIAGSDSGLGRR